LSVTYKHRAWSISAAWQLPNSDCGADRALHEQREPLTKIKAEAAGVGNYASLAGGWIALLSGREMETMASTYSSAAPIGTVLAVRGGVVDVKFTAGQLPRIEEALAVERDGGEALIIEVPS
jgi:hypothetical protein